MADIEHENGSEEIEQTEGEEAMNEEQTEDNGDQIEDEQNEGNGGNDGEESKSESKDDDDDDSRKIFIGGLSWETTAQDLKDYFGKYGTVSDATLKTDPNTGRSRGFGFVTFATPADVDTVMSEKNHKLNGRTLDPQRAKPRPGKEVVKKVFVGGLDPSTPEDEIRKYFSKYGKIVEIDLPYDKAKGQRRAYCFIAFETGEIADTCCKEAKQNFNGKEVDVRKATPKSQDGQGGWGRGGWSGGGGGRGGRGGRGGFQGGYGGYGGYDGGYGYGGYDGGYDGGYGGYGGYDNQGWGDYNSGYGGGYGGGYGNGYNAGGGYGNGGYGKARRGRGAGYHPYSK